jgi:type VI secretion system protein VasD
MWIFEVGLRKIALVLLAFFVAMAVEGCGSSPTRLEANVTATQDANKEAGGHPLPIVVRIYELKTAGSFQSADFFSLYDHEDATLGGDLLAREELNLRPGEQLRIERATDPDAQYVGVLGAYRDIDNAIWRATHGLQRGKTNKLQIELGPSSVSIR